MRERIREHGVNLRLGLADDADAQRDPSRKRTHVRRCGWPNPRLRVTRDPTPYGASVVNRAVARDRGVEFPQVFDYVARFFDMVHCNVASPPRQSS